MIEMETHFGIDLSGYGKRETVVAKLSRTKAKEIKVELDHSLQQETFKGKDHLDEALERDVKKIKEVLEVPDSKVAIDVPIDLQGLEDFPQGEKVWSLTKRPIDQAFNGQPPLASYIGYLVARFQAVLNRGGLREEVGKRIFETYPAGSMKLMNIDSKGYKSSPEARRRLIKDLNISSPGTKLSDDHIDAILAGLACFDEVSLEGEELAERINLEYPIDGFNFKSKNLPKGYRLVSDIESLDIRVTGVEAE